MINIKKNNYLSVLVLTLLVFIGLFAVSGCTEQAGNAENTDMGAHQNPDPAGPFKINVMLDPQTPKVGKNKITISVKDLNGNPVNSAKLKIVAVMPAMGSMPAMYAPADMQETKPGVYEGEFEPTMSGEWPLTIDIEAENMGKGSITYDLATGRRGLRCATCKSMTGNTNDKIMASGSQLDPAGPYRVKVNVNPEKPKVGINQVKIIVEDKEGNTIRGADLKAVAIMPAMGSMPAMYAPAEMQETSPGVYQGEFEPTMSGEWPLTIDIVTDTMGQGSITYDLATGRKGLRCANCKGPESSTEGSIQVDNYRRQLIGVTTTKAERQDLVKQIRAAGRITYDETRLVDVTLKFNGWVGKLQANYTGIPVRKGDPLFTVYSPDLLAAQEEYLETFRRSNKTQSTRMLRAARRKLLLWDLSEQQITALEKNGKASEYISINSPASGIVVIKNIVEGSAIKTGEKLFRIADVSQVWAEAQIYDYEIPLVKIGMPANVILPELQDREFASQVSYIYPYMQSDTRTAKVRLVLNNTDGFLRPDMYVQIHLKAILSNRLVVPESAVLYAGQTRVVFVDLGEGRLQPRRIKTGVRNQQYIEVLEGLESGEVVVTSGNFLIASEAKLKTGVDQW